MPEPFLRPYITKLICPEITGLRSNVINITAYAYAAPLLLEISLLDNDRVVRSKVQYFRRGCTRSSNNSPSISR